MRASAELAVPDDSKSVRAGAVKAWRYGAKSMIIKRKSILRQLSEQIPFDINAPWRDLPQKVRDTILFGDPSRTFMLRLRRGNSRPEPVEFGGVLRGPWTESARLPRATPCARASAFSKSPPPAPNAAGRGSPKGRETCSSEGFRTTGFLR